MKIGVTADLQGEIPSAMYRRPEAKYLQEKINIHHSSQTAAQVCMILHRKNRDIRLYLTSFFQDSDNVA